MIGRIKDEYVAWSFPMWRLCWDSSLTKLSSEKYFSKPFLPLKLLHRPVDHQSLPSTLTVKDLHLFNNIHYNNQCRVRWFYGDLASAAELDIQLERTCSARTRLPSRTDPTQAANDPTWLQECLAKLLGSLQASKVTCLVRLTLSQFDQELGGVVVVIHFAHAKFDKEQPHLPQYNGDPSNTISIS